MEDGGVVDDMMQSVLPWSNDDDKMIQFMEETLGARQSKRLAFFFCRMHNLSCLSFSPFPSAQSYASI